MNWQPIATAPKDGTEIIIFKRDWPFAPVAKWVHHDADDDKGQSIVFGGWGFDEWTALPGAMEDGFIGWNEDIEDGMMPTHWMPEKRKFL